MTSIKLHWQILIAILLAILAGSLSGTNTIYWELMFMRYINLLARCF
jgi:cytochrome b561